MHFPFPIKLIRTQKLSANISLSVHPDRGVTVRAPFWLPDFAIRKFIQERQSWIERHLKKIKLTKPIEKLFTDGEKHLFFGQEYELKISEIDSIGRTQIDIGENCLLVKVSKHHGQEKRQTEIKDSLLRWYLERGIGAITEKVNFYCSQLGVEYSQIDIKKVSSIWGSCSAKNKLSFNRKLIMAPHEVVDYVVIHEVCHLVHRNHSSRFWALVARLDPDYKNHKRWLYRNHSLLII